MNEDDRSVDELHEEIVWDDDGFAQIHEPDYDLYDDSEQLDRLYGREY